MARPLLEQVLGVEVTCLVPSEAGAFLRWAGGRAPLFVLISQSGISTNTYELAGELRRSGRPVLALTEGDDTPVAQAAGLSAALPVSDEHIGAKTKGVTATALALMLMGLAVRPDSALLTALEGLPGGWRRPSAAPGCGAGTRPLPWRPARISPCWAAAAP
jgi:fructoselysine-6-P-deglycase FrlB-like protein